MELMSQGTTALMGAIAGFTIFIGLPVARLKGLSRSTQGFLNALATGILVFLLWDILSHAGEPVEAAIKSAGSQGFGPFAGLIAIFAGGLGAGLLLLTYFNGMVMSRLKLREAATPGSAIPPQAIALSIATGLGLHNFSEGLAIGQSAASGAIAFAGVLVIGFALHNITEGFGIAAPMATTPRPVSWGFIAMAGLIGGGPTFLGTLLGYVVTAQPVYVLFLALAAGALIYVLNELFAVGRRLAPPKVFAWGVLLGLLAAYGTDLLLVYVGG
jgi:ZIP family zinc transporter